MNKNIEMLQYYYKELQKQGYNVVYIGLYGSQNYNVDDNNSDIDARALVIPSLKDIIARKVISKVIAFPGKGEVDVKDVYTFYQVIRKGNFSFLEVIHTDYYVGDSAIRLLFGSIPLNLKSAWGAMYQKRKDLEHPYPTKKREIDTWGFDPKQWHHIIRLEHLIISHILGDSRCFLNYEGRGRENMIAIKRNIRDYTVQDARFACDLALSTVEKIIPVDYKYNVIDLDDQVYEYIEKHIKI